MTAESLEKMLAQGDCLFRQGEIGDCAYVVEDGKLEISTTNGGQRKVVATLVKGDIVGEMALIDNQPRAASATALGPCRLRVITRDYLNDRMQAGDPLLRHLMRILIRRGRGLLNLSGDAAALRTGVTAAEDRRRVLETLELDQSLRLALEREEFELHYQPIVRMSDGAPAGFEALIRWNRPGHGCVSPGVFMPYAEQTNFINELGHWIIRRACRELQRLEAAARRAKLGHPLTISVNLSGRQFGDPRLFEVLAAALQESGVSPQQVRLEVTETMLLDDFDLGIKVLKQGRELGVQLALDDFGTGYSSLSYLHKFPVDTLKLDYSFTRELLSNDASRKIVHGIITLADDLGMNVVAEGTETEEQTRALRELGAEYGQGFFFGRGLPIAEAEAYIGRDDRWTP